MTDLCSKTTIEPGVSSRRAPSQIVVPYPRWKVELFRTRTADLQSRGAAHATGRAVRAPGP
jgi:hypothetical protein